ncbi:hypothetical protein EVAR_7994_1 [Eumeta japonica]|uniref:Uncharacterized protein n=1 Tax=Eumeta variegata TaxID=151549 RepID=A0A4C1TI40_EUMVA|nr:hypothetical protein EVAR_7994_1 [Eumeta japonica]
MHSQYKARHKPIVKTESGGRQRPLPAAARRRGDATRCATKQQMTLGVCARPRAPAAAPLRMLMWTQGPVSATDLRARIGPSLLRLRPCDATPSTSRNSYERRHDAPRGRFGRGVSAPLPINE